MPKGLSVIVAFMMISAVVLLWVGYEIATSQTILGAPIARSLQRGTLVGIIPALLGVVYLGLSVGLLLLRSWARAATMGLCAVGLVFGLVLLPLAGNLAVASMAGDAGILIYLARRRAHFD